jgi:hypothetical protein
LYTTGTLLAGLHEVQSTWNAQRQRRFLVLLGVVAAALAPINVGRFRIKEENSLALSTSVRTALEMIAAEAPASGADVALDGHTYGAFRYYTILHRDTKDALGAAYAAPRFRVHPGGFSLPKWKVTLDGLLMPVAYVVVSKPGFITPTRKQMTRRCASFTEQTLTGTTIFRCVRRTDQAPTAPDAADADDDADADSAHAPTP